MVFHLIMSFATLPLAVVAIAAMIIWILIINKNGC